MGWTVIDVWMRLNFFKISGEFLSISFHMLFGTP